MTAPHPVRRAQGTADPNILQAYITLVRRGVSVLRLGVSALKRPLGWTRMIPEKNDVVTCVFVATAALLLGFLRCSGCLTMPD